MLDYAYFIDCQEILVQSIYNDKEINLFWESIERLCHLLKKECQASPWFNYSLVKISCFYLVFDNKNIILVFQIFDEKKNYYLFVDNNTGFWKLLQKRSPCFLKLDQWTKQFN